MSTKYNVAWCQRGGQWAYADTESGNVVWRQARSSSRAKHVANSFSHSQAKRFIGLHSNGRDLLEMVEK